MRQAREPEWEIFAGDSGMATKGRNGASLTDQQIEREILEAVADYPLTRTQLRDKLPASKGRVTAAIDRLIDAGEIAHVTYRHKDAGGRKRGDKAFFAASRVKKAADGELPEVREEDL